ncbi:hypothetical protein F4775DRAFT_606224 [Biscogniauxia sp. FL1348]|nr:hypothetical protein F4775DRAFT_606224 [Biscogniauxia sp. FL1348]
MPSSSQQARDTRPPTSAPGSHAQASFNRITDVDFSEESLRQFDIPSEREAHGNTIEKLTESRVTSIMDRYSPYLTGPQYTNLRTFLACVIDSLYRISYRQALPRGCVSVRAALEHLPYGGGHHGRDTLRLRYVGASSSSSSSSSATHLARLWRLVVRRASSTVLPTNIALDLGCDAPEVAISLLGPDGLGEFNLREAMQALGNVVELASSGLETLMFCGAGSSTAAVMEKLDAELWERFGIGRITQASLRVGRIPC